MPKQLVIRGLPQSLARDGWWLTSEEGGLIDQTPPVSPSHRHGASGRHGPRLFGLILLVLVGDQLFWGHNPGLSLALFAWCVFGVAIADSVARRGVTQATGLLLVATLPILEHVQTLSLAILTLGLLSALAFLRIPAEIKARDIGPWVAIAVIRLIKSLPTAGIVDSFAGIRAAQSQMTSRESSSRVSVHKFARDWAFPLGGMLVLSTLLISANPVLEHMLVRVLRFNFDAFALTRRLVFWAGLALLVWPFLTARAPEAPLDFKVPDLNVSRLLNAGSVMRALIAFNIMLALQSVLDISILFGGATLPEGMSHATYAHRGAYPLLITALLAGVFALAAKPFLTQHPALKPLLLLWLAQNVLLTLSAAFRLHLYIDVFGLTYLRIHAFIWMALVAAGLGLVLWQVLRDRSSSWLLLRVAALGAGTLYACAFVNFAAVIATHTLSRSVDTQAPIAVDWDYLCGLGPTAAAAIEAGVRTHATQPIPLWAEACVHPAPTDPNWREWDFRTARVNGYLAANSDAKGSDR